MCVYTGGVLKGSQCKPIKQWRHVCTAVRIFVQCVVTLYGEKCLVDITISQSLVLLPHTQCNNTSTVLIIALCNVVWC